MSRDILDEDGGDMEGGFEWVSAASTLATTSHQEKEH